jgi:allophanate hydrolase
VAERTADLGEFITAHPHDVHPVVREIIAGGERFSAAELFRTQHRRAELARTIIPTWRAVDFMLVPTTGTAYSIEEVLAEPVKLNTNLGYYTTFANLLDLSAIAIPNGFTAKGFPSGVMLIGPAWHDASLATHAAALHRNANLPLGATGWAMPGASVAPVEAAEASYPRVEIVVFGAHMRREPLNHELARLDAIFCRSCRTAPLYRMFALEGAIARPALARVAVDGRSLEGELWSLPIEAAGPLLAGIAPPLGLGKVMLDDGTMRIGFICEADAIGNARDISEFGGWRSYRASMRSPG